jgi:hypothetical protein
MPQTPEEMLSAVSESLAARTGRSLEDWLALVRSSGLDPLDQAAHKLSLQNVQEVDAEVLHVLRMAYEQNA